MSQPFSEHTDPRAASSTQRSIVPLMLIAVIVAYAASFALGLPQRATRIIADAAHGEPAASHPPAGNAGGAAASEQGPPGAGGESAVAAAHAAEEARADATAAEKVDQPPPVWMILPFALILGAIAVLPLIPATAHWWEHNSSKFIVAAILAGVTLAYFLFFHQQPIHAHWPAHHVTHANPEGVNVLLTWDVFANAMLAEYVPFIVLLFSLFTISGGIRLEGNLPAHPATNTAFMAVGAVLASVIGTTGAAMLLVRPLLETNSERKRVAHTVIFFIFIVCNCGGLLLPTGDPPLYLGYLMGVPFLWTLHLWPEWAFVNGSLLVIYYGLDHFYHYPREAKADVTLDESRIRPLKVEGLLLNGLLFAGVIFAAALLDPSKLFPGTQWRPWIYLREVVQLGLVAVSLLAGDPRVRRANSFNFGAILEVAVLFFGIFITMQPALQYLSIRGPSLGLTEPWQFFWASGSLSSFLDNAPTYVVFFQTAQALTAAKGLTHTVAGVAQPLLAAISLGSVFMGANTYIGNGPNFMVKSIAESSNVKMPSFFGYMVYSILVLIPLFLLTTFLFIR